MSLGDEIEFRRPNRAVALWALRQSTRYVEQRTKCRRKSGDVGSLEGNQQLLERSTTTPDIGLSFNDPSHGLRLLLALRNEEAVDVRNFDTVFP